MKKRIVSLLLALVLMLSVVPVPAHAATVASGSCGEAVTWTLDSAGTMIISGTGEMEEYYYWTLPWKDYTSSIQKVVVEDGVTTLGSYAFYGCTNLSAVTLPDSLTAVGKYAFQGCTSLTDVDLGSGVTDIALYSFSGCTALTSVTIPASVETISQSAFAFCTNLANVTFEEAAASDIMLLGGYESGLRIGIYAFRDCMGLTNVYLPSHLVSVDGESFGGCMNLQGVWADTTQTLDGVEGPKYLSDSKGVLYEYSYDYEKDEYYAYMLCCVPAQLSGAYTIKSTVTSIDASFYGCSKLTSLTFPTGAGGIHNTEAFFGCTSLAKVTAGVGNDGGWYNDAAGALLCKRDSSVALAFVPVNNTSYTVAAEVTSIYGAAFTGGTLKSIQVESGNANYTSKDGVLYTADGTKLVAHPPAATASSFVVPETVTCVEEYAFAFASAMKDIWFTDTVVSVNSDAFYGINVTCHYPAGNEEWEMVLMEIAASSNSCNITWEPYDELQQEKELEAPTVKTSGKASSGKPVVKWNAVEGAEKYVVYRATSKNGKYKKLKTTTKTSYTDSSAKAGATYYYKVKSVDADGETSEFSNRVSRTCDLAQPKVTVKNTASTGKAKLSWKEIDGAEKYVVYRATSKSGEYKKLKTTSNTSYTDSSAKVGKRYYYKVVAVHENSSANSAKSEVVSAIRDLAQPKASVSLTKKGYAKVKWGAVEDAEKYVVYRATSKSGEYKKLKTTASASFTDKSVKAGKTYYYKVVAVHETSAANSAKSAVVKVKVK